MILSTMRLAEGRPNLRPSFTTVLLILILILAAIVRIGWPGLTEFKYDEATSLRHGVRLVRDGVLPPIIASSISGLPHPPLMAYLMAIPWLFVRDPAFVVMFFGAMGVAAVYLTYWLGARYFGVRVGLVAAALFAAAPWAIFYTRKLWAQDVPLLTLIMMIGLYKLIVERRWWGIAPAVIVAVLLPGLYLGNVVFLVILAAALAIHWRAVWGAFREATRRDRWLWGAVTLIGVAVLLIAMSPWISAFLGGGIQPTGGEAADRGLEPVAQIRQALKIATGYEWQSLAGDQIDRYYDLLPRSYDWLNTYVIVFMLIGMVVVLFRAAWPKPDPSPLLISEVTGEVVGGRAKYSLLAVWMLVPLIIWTVSGLDPQPHRYLTLYPTQFLALAILFHGDPWQKAAQDRRQLLSTAAITVLLLGVIAWWLIQYATMMRLIDSTRLNAGHAPPAQIQWEAGREARRLAEPDNLPIIVNGTGDDPAIEGEAAAWDVLLGDLDLRLIEGEAVTLNPAQGGVHIYTRADAQYDIARIEGLGDTSPAAAKLANGVEFLRVEPAGLEAQIQPGADVFFSAIWRVWGIPPTGEDYAYSVQLFDADWLRYVNINDHFLRTGYWREGDVIGTSGVLRIPDDAPAGADYHLVITLYTIAADGTVTPVAVVDEAFNKIGEYVEVPLE